MISPSSQSGFALLMTIIVVGVVTAIGLSILDLSIKQIRLTTTSRDSELAFHAANAGLECARLIRLSSSTEMEIGVGVGPRCFGVVSNPAEVIQNLKTTAPAPLTSAPASGDGEVFRYQWNFTWGDLGSQRCSRMTLLVASTTPFGLGVTTTNMTTLFPGFESAAHYCEPSARCSVISVQGFNRPCSNVGLPGTVQREVLLQF